MSNNLRFLLVYTFHGWVSPSTIAARIGSIALYTLILASQQTSKRDSKALISGQEEVVGLSGPFSSSFGTLYMMFSVSRVKRPVWLGPS